MSCYYIQSTSRERNTIGFSRASQFLWIFGGDVEFSLGFPRFAQDSECRFLWVFRLSRVCVPLSRFSRQWLQCIVLTAGDVEFTPKRQRRYDFGAMWVERSGLGYFILTGAESCVYDVWSRLHNSPGGRWLLPGLRELTGQIQEQMAHAPNFCTRIWAGIHRIPPMLLSISEFGVPQPRYRKWKSNWIIKIQIFFENTVFFLNCRISEKNSFSMNKVIFQKRLCTFSFQKLYVQRKSVFSIIQFDFHLRYRLEKHISWDEGMLAAVTRTPSPQDPHHQKKPKPGNSEISKLPWMEFKLHNKAKTDFPRQI